MSQLKESIYFEMTMVVEMVVSRSGVCARTTESARKSNQTRGQRMGRAIRSQVRSKAWRWDVSLDNSNGVRPSGNGVHSSDDHARPRHKGGV